MLPVQRFSDFVSQNQLFNNGDAVLAAVSGGMDSVLMVRLLSAAGCRFAIAHCNFQLRGAEADADQAFCKRLAETLKVQFHTINFDTSGYAAQHKISIQMAARELRYRWFEQLRAENSYAAIALAHHQNDAIETILLNLTRGTGIAGLHGILPRNGHLVRPLLFMPRVEIEQIIHQNNIEFREDSSNSSTKYARNKLRHEVIPKLKELNPALEQTFEQNLDRFRQLEQLLEAELAKQQMQFIEHNDEQHLSIEAIKNMQPAPLLLYGLLHPYGYNETQVNDLIASLDKHSGRQFESDSYLLVLDRNKIILKPKSTQPYTPVTIMKGDRELHYGNYRLTVMHDDSPLIVKDNPLAVSVDADLLVYPLTMRAWQQGDYFYPLGMQSKQKLSDFFVHQKVPLHQKPLVPVLVNGNNEIIWLSGYRLDNRYKVSNNTKKVTIFELYNLP